MDFPKGHTALSLEPAPITSITFLLDSGRTWTVGEDGITAIEAYDENGQMSHVPWIAVVRADQIVMRTPAEAVCVSYEKPF